MKFFIKKDTILKCSQNNYRQFFRFKNYLHNSQNNFDGYRKSIKISSNSIRNLFLDYFVNEKNHKYIKSSPVFLNNDPSLLFVNAGMNQFRSKLLGKTYPGHPFHELKRAANSQKCVRLSGKHNDLKDVGVDLYHHTFFEMLGSWSFGDYSKFDACRMAWDLLTNIYGLNPQNLYVTYFEGDSLLGIPSDEECKKIWLELGVNPNHIFPFGAKDNFWEMADKGLCGPCTEIHYDFTGSGYQKVALEINKDKPTVMEIWNIVFIQYNRDQNGILKSLPYLNIDTGMGFERLTAVLQGTNSNYNTDIFNPIFNVIQNNFRVQPYLGRTGSSDHDGVDTAYRILADHSRMFSVAVADGMFPDNFDAGHVLRKIIRRAAYAANRVMKTKPGALSSLVPYVADTLDFFPEVAKHIEEIKYVVNEEERLFHQTINRGRKARNKMITESDINVLNGLNVWELQKVHGLEDNIIRDLAEEDNLSVDWEDFKKVLHEKQQLNQKKNEEKTHELLQILEQLKEKNISLTDNSFKYCYDTDQNKYGVHSIVSSILAIFEKNEISSSVEEGNYCIVVTDKSNFYPESGGQASDIGTISNEDFVFKVEHTYFHQGYVFHHGTVSTGILNPHKDVKMLVDSDYRLSCSQNHTATHLVNAALRKILPYTVQRSSFVGPDQLTLGFSAKSQLTPSELDMIEKFVNTEIHQKHTIAREEMMFEELLDQPNAVLLRGEEYPDVVSVISIGNPASECISIEPCCGTHVHNTSDLLDFVIIPSKSCGKSIKVISAVTGSQASLVRKNYAELELQVLNIKTKVDDAFTKVNVPLLVFINLLKDLNLILKKVHSSSDAPLLKLEECRSKLQDLKQKLNDIINHSAKTDLNLDSSATRKLGFNFALESLKMKNILKTEDSFKFNYDNLCVKPISANILALFMDQKQVESVARGLQCQIILDKTNFYAEEDDQACDEGHISCADFSIKIHNSNKVDGYVFHDGFVEEGTVAPNQAVQLTIDQDHRLACSQNHTALHLLNYALKKELPYFFPCSSKCDSKQLELMYTTKGIVNDGQLQNVENYVNKCISENMSVSKRNISIESLPELPAYKSSLVSLFKDKIPTISIGTEDSPISLEPCCGTHVISTGAIGSFVILTHKAIKGKEKMMRAATGKEAEIIKANGKEYHQSLLEVEEYAANCLKQSSMDYLELWDCLQDVKSAKVFQESEIPLLLFRSHQEILSDLSTKLTIATNGFVQAGFEKIKSEMPLVLQKFCDKNFIVYVLESTGDGRKILNYAVENSSDKPSMYFIKDGRRSVICSCSVPKHLVNSSFSALLWINPVASLLEGQARNLTKDPELFYSVLSSRLDRLNEAVQLAEKILNDFIESA